MAQKIFVFGHYDSRGGTTGILADTKEEAFQRYLLDVLCSEESDPDWEVLKESALYDFLCEGTIEDAPAVPPEGIDLEETGTVLVNIPQFHERNRTETQGIRFLYVPVPLEVKPGWYHPSWDDDAYGFILMGKKGK